LAVFLILKIRCWIEFVLVRIFFYFSSLSAFFLVELGGNQCRYDNPKRLKGGHVSDTQVVDGKLGCNRIGEGKGVGGLFVNFFEMPGELSRL
jgi:hypothetical protein